MKKLVFLFTVICLLFLSCSNANNSSSEKGQAYQNNATDDIFETSVNPDYDYCSSIKHTTGFLNGYIRKEGSSGIIGTWYKYYDKKYSTYRIEELTFNSDGTWNNITTYPKKNEIDRDSGKYELYENDGDFYIKIFWSTREYNLQYFVSDNYYCHEDSGCPI